MRLIVCPGLFVKPVAPCNVHTYIYTLRNLIEIEFLLTGGNVLRATVAMEFLGKWSYESYRHGHEQRTFYLGGETQKEVQDYGLHLEPPLGEYNLIPHYYYRFC